MGRECSEVLVITLPPQKSCPETPYTTLQIVFSKPILRLV